MISKTLAPRTLRMPISLVLFSARNEASPNRPRQAVNSARMVNSSSMDLILRSDW